MQQDDVKDSLIPTYQAQAKQTNSTTKQTNSWTIYAEIIQPAPPLAPVMCCTHQCKQLARVTIRKNKSKAVMHNPEDRSTRDASFQDVCMDCVAKREQSIGYNMTYEDGTCVIL
jgi:hypothetical protein